MPRFTLIARLSDHLPLAASIEEERDQANGSVYKSQAKKIIKQLNTSSPERCTIESSPYAFHYLIAGSSDQQKVIFLVFTEKSYPKRLAYNYLEELCKEFQNLYSNQIEQPTLRPYAFIKFETFIQKTKKLYIDSRTQRNLKILNDELQDVHKIMTKNIQDVLNRGEKLEEVSNEASKLANAASRYKDRTRELYRHHLWQQYGFWGVIVLVLLFVMFLYFKVYR